MIFVKIVKQDMGRLKKTHPDLFVNIQKHLPHLSSEGQGIVAGLIIEHVIKAEGDIDVFQDNDFMEEVDDGLEEVV